MDLSSLSDSDLQAIAGQQGGLAAISQGILGQESGNNPNILPSIDGAIGAAQIMPATFAQYAKPGEDINNPADNMAVHQRILADLSQKSGGDPARIAVGYFSGPGNIAPSDSSTPWKSDRTDGNGKSVSSYVSDVLGRLNPISSANAAEMPPTQDLSHLSDAQLAAIAQPDPSGMGAQPWSALHIQSQALPPIDPNSPQAMAQNATNSLADQGNSGLRGFLAHETAMGANAISGVPGLKELGSSLAALAGAGQDNGQGQGIGGYFDRLGQRYNNLEGAQAAMRAAGKESDPVASTLARIGGITGGLGLGAETLAAILPEFTTATIAGLTATHPYYTNMGIGGALGALQGFADGEDTKSRLSGAASGGLINALTSLPLTYAARNIVAPILGAVANKFGPGLAGDVASGGSDIPPPGGGGGSVTTEGVETMAPRETDLSKIDLNTPIKPYENLVNPADFAPSVAPEVTAVQVNDLKKTVAKITQLQAVGSKDPAGISYLNQLQSHADDLRQQLGMVAAPEVSQTAEQVAPEVAPTAPEPVAPAAPQKSNVFPMSAGQATQNPELQRMEADAVAGASGEKAQVAANSFRAMQNDAFKEHLDTLAKTQPNGNPADSMGTAVKFIRANEGLADQGVNDAYAQARKLAPGLAAPAPDMQQYLQPELNKIADEKSFDSGDMNTANALYKKLLRLINSPNGASITNLEGWRRAATSNTQGAPGAQKYAIRQLINAYDNYMGDLAGRMTTAGDTETGAAINAFKNAVATRRAYGQMFEGNPLVEKLIAGDASVDDVTKQFIGSGAVGGKTGMLENYNALLKASSDQAPEVSSLIKNAFAQNIYNRSVSGKLANSDVEAISPAKMKTELENLFIKQRDFATTLFGADATRNAQQAVKELSLITSKQANVGNAPNSGYTLARLAKASGLISHIPIVGKVFEAAKFIGEKSAESAQAATAAQLFSGVVPKSAQAAANTGIKSGVVTPFVVNSLKSEKRK